MAEIQGMHDRSGLDFGLVTDRRLAAHRFGGRRTGPYRVVQVGEASMLVNHGGSAFPVGTRLGGDDYGSCAPHDVTSSGLAGIIDHARHGHRAAWRSSVSGEM